MSADRAPIAARRLFGGRMAHAVPEGADRALCGAPNHASARWRADGAAAAGVVTCKDCIKRMAREART